MAVCESCRIARANAMISQPMRSVASEEEILETKERATKALEEMGYDVVNTYFDDEWSKKENMKARGVVNISVAFMAKSLEKMAECKAVYFCKGWESQRGCKIEHAVAEAYGLDIFYED